MGEEESPGVDRRQGRLGRVVLLLASVVACLVVAKVVLGLLPGEKADLREPKQKMTVPVGAEPVLGAYRLKENDVIELTVFGEPELATSTRILETGEAVFPLVGAVEIAGLALAEATERVRGLYAADYLLDPRLTLTVVDCAVERMWVLGAVNAPGAVPIPPSGKLDLASALARAGGLAADADPDRIKLIRAAGGRLVHSWVAIQGTALSAGDRIVVHENRFLDKVVSILGQVRKPGPVAFPLDGELDLVTAIALAGGFSEVANREKVTVSRAGRNMQINMGEGNEQKALQFKLRPGDVVTVAERMF